MIDLDRYFTKTNVFLLHKIQSCFSSGRRDDKPLESSMLKGEVHHLYILKNIAHTHLFISETSKREESATVLLRRKTITPDSYCNGRACKGARWLANAIRLT